MKGSSVEKGDQDKFGNHEESPCEPLPVALLLEDKYGEEIV